MQDIRTRKIDHFIFGGRDADLAEREFASLGFSLRSRSRLTGAGEGLCNNLAYMADERYLELVSVLDFSKRAYDIPRAVLARPGLIKLALRTDDVLKCRQEALRAGLKVEGPVRHEVDFLSDGQRYQGRFEVAFAWDDALPTLGLVFVNYLQRYDSSALRGKGHPNGAIDVSRLYLVGDHYAAGPFLSLLGDPGRDGDMLTAMTAEEWRRLLGLSETPSFPLPVLAGIEFIVRNLGEVRRHLAANKVPFHERDEVVIVPGSAAANTTFLFKQAEKEVMR